MKALTGKDSDQGSKSGRQLVRAEASLVDLSRLSSLCRRREEEEEGVEEVVGARGGGIVGIG